jgi:hypothetical protein
MGMSTKYTLGFGYIAKGTKETKRVKGIDICQVLRDKIAAKHKDEIDEDLVEDTIDEIVYDLESGEGRQIRILNSWEDNFFGVFSKKSIVELKYAPVSTRPPEDGWIQELDAVIEEYDLRSIVTQSTPTWHIIPRYV